MPRVLRLFCVMLVLFAVQCFADSVKNVSNANANLNILPNDGLGDNLGGTLVGSGLNLTVGGGTPVFWFSATDGYAPGSGGGGSTTIYFDSVFGTIGKNSYDNLNINAANLNASGFTFPTNGSGFTISVPASIGVIVVQGCNSQGCDTFNITTRSGTLTMSFFFSDGFYYASTASFASNSAPVPEPSTLALLAIGLGGVPWRKARKKRRTNAAS